MTEFKVKYDQLDWEDDCIPYGAVFNGEKFSGIAFSEHGDELYEEWSFGNGIFNGRNFLYDKTKQELLREEFYEKGIPVKTHFKWVDYHFFKHIKSYFNGQLETIKIEDQNGKLLLQFDREQKKFTEWFDTGVKSSEKDLISTDNLYQFKKQQFWNEGGIWLMTITDQINNQFNEEYLFLNSDKLDTEQENKIFILFSEYLLANNPELGLNFLKSHVKHHNPFFRYQVARLLSKSKDLNAIPFLEELQQDHLQPETKLKMNWDGSGTAIKTEYSISKMAKIAIETIKNNVKGSI